MRELPIHSVVPEIQRVLNSQPNLVLEAPAGAGKTTIVPLELLSQPWLRGKIIMLEPRRMAAKAAAERMASLLGEKVGQRVGYRIRQETEVGPETRIEVVTGGVFTRLLQEDPSLSAYDLVIFDEFHERNLDSDVGLALALHGRALFRDQSHPLKILVMSATLDGQRIAALLNHTPVVRSQGKMFPVDIEYRNTIGEGDLVEQTCTAIRHALDHQQGSILVFLPGEKEIMTTRAALANTVPTTVRVAPLYGALSLQEQRRAIAPIEANAPTGTRKVVLATDVAETSLTIEGITVVIDCGFRRSPFFDARTGLTRLRTVRISQASAVQRTGRAGRLAPGHCYRLWRQEENLSPFTPADILQADLAALALQLLVFGVADVAELQWLDAPPLSAYQQGLQLLQDLGAVELSVDSARLTAHGQQMASFPAHPRLAHMMLSGTRVGLKDAACVLAAILSEPSKGPMEGEDKEHQVEQYLAGQVKPGPWLQRIKKQVAQYRRLITAVHDRDAPTDSTVGFLLACAYPDRIARQRGHKTNTYQLSNGRAAVLSDGSALINNEYLAVAEIGGFAGRSDDRIFSAARLNPTLFDHCLTSLIHRSDVAQWDQENNRFIAEERTCIGAIVLKRHPRTDLDSAQKSRAVCAYIKQSGWHLLPWNNEIKQWCSRIELLRERPECNPPALPAWPNVSEPHLRSNVHLWLEPYLARVSGLNDIQRLDLLAILRGTLSWPLPEKLDQWAPTHFQAPSGSRIAIDYSQAPPIIAVKLQEMFGCQTTPTVANGSVNVTVHLLSPARRPLQITQDLAGFWRSSYHEIKKEMKGRYPKHPWPDDPLTAPPTRHTKKRSV